MQIQVLGHPTVVNQLCCVAKVGHHSVVVFLAQLRAGQFTGLFKHFPVDYTFFCRVSSRKLLVDGAPLVPKLGPNVLFAYLLLLVLTRAIRIDADVCNWPCTGCFLNFPVGVFIQILNFVELKGLFELIQLARIWSAIDFQIQVVNIITVVSSCLEITSVAGLALHVGTRWPFLKDPLIFQSLAITRLRPLRGRLAYIQTFLANLLDCASRSEKVRWSSSRCALAPKQLLLLLWLLSRILLSASV